MVTGIDRTSGRALRLRAVPETFDGGSNATVGPAVARGGDGPFLRADSYPYVTVEAEVAWLPLADALRRECYALIAEEDGLVCGSAKVDPAQGAPPGNCWLSTTTASATIALR